MATNNAQILSLYRGEDANLVGSAGTATDITGWAIAFTIANYAGAAPVHVLTVGAGIALTAPATGVFTVSLTRAQTSALTSEWYFWDAWHVNDGAYERLAGGRLMVMKPVFPPVT